MRKIVWRVIVMSNSFVNPFEIFGIEAKFNIENLDETYYALYALNHNLDAINTAYKTLKDQLTRATYLCNLNGYDQKDNTIAQEVFKQAASISSQQVDDALAKVFEHAERGEWQQTWYWVQKHSYMKQFLNR